jgi:hypothetical protein
VSLSLGNLIWLGNPLLFSAWVVIWRGEKAISVWLGALSVGVIAAFMLVRTVVTNEGGVPLPIRGVMLGYWLWLGSAVVALLAALVGGRVAKI